MCTLIFYVNSWCHILRRAYGFSPFIVGVKGREQIQGHVYGFFSIRGWCKRMRKQIQRCRYGFSQFALGVKIFVTKFNGKHLTKRTSAVRSKKSSKCIFASCMYQWYIFMKIINQHICTTCAWSHNFKGVSTGYITEIGTSNTIPRWR